MPNYIRNILKIDAPPERVEEILSQIKSDTNPEQLIDFNKIIPLPKELEISAGSQEELVSLYMTYINPEVDYYGVGHKERDVLSVHNEVFKFNKNLKQSQIERMLTRFNRNTKEQCF